MLESAIRKLPDLVIDTMQECIDGFRGAKVLNDVLILSLEPPLREDGQSKRFKKKWAVILADLPDKHKVEIDWV